MKKFTPESIEINTDLALNSILIHKNVDDYCAKVLPKRLAKFGLVKQSNN